jgi:ribosomal protein S18 acetylase RimI-like enzyme
LNSHIRPFAPGDQPLARKLILDGLQGYFDYIDPNLNQDLVDIYSSYVLEGHEFLVAERGGLLVATGGLLVLDSSTGRIVRISVHKDHRGMGIGRTMVNRLIDLGRLRGLNYLVAETNLDWFAAIALYKGCGFFEQDRDDESVHFELSIG